MRQTVPQLYGSSKCTKLDDAANQAVEAVSFVCLRHCNERTVRNLGQGCLDG